MIINENRNIYFICGTKQYQFLAETAPPAYKKKVELLLCFSEYMDNNLVSGTTQQHNKHNTQTQQAKAPVFVKAWLRSIHAVTMLLNTGTLQVNFVGEHTKLVLSTMVQQGKFVQYVTYIDRHRKTLTYDLQQLRSHGCSADVIVKLRYALKKLNKMWHVHGHH